MKKRHFVWTRGIEKVIHETLSGKRENRVSNTGVITKLFDGLIEGSEHYYSFVVTRYELGKTWKAINRSSTYRRLERNERLSEAAGFLFTAFELQKVLAAPSGSIVLPTFGIGGFSFEVIKPTDPDYQEAFSRLPGTT